MARLKKIRLVVAFIALALLFVFAASPVYAVTTWDSYNDPGRSTPDDSFAGTETTVYMEGTGFITANFYKVGYYDGADRLVGTDTTWTDTGTLQSDYYFPSDPTAVAGTWHSVVFDTTGDIPDDYNNASSDQAYVVEDDFSVDQSVIPEFPTVMAMVVAMGLSLGIYYRMRKNYHRQAVTAEQ